MQVYQRRKKRRWDSVGETVETSSREEGFLGSWFQATVVAGGGDGGGDCSSFVTVRYTTLVNDAEMPLEGRVATDMIRPVPPLLLVEIYRKGEAVEAFDREGWWSGIVTTLLPGGLYKVYFPESFDECVYPPTKLRPRQDWLDGAWRRAPCIPLELPSISDVSQCSQESLPSSPRRKRQRVNESRKSEAAAAATAAAGAPCCSWLKQLVKEQLVMEQQQSLRGESSKKAVVKGLQKLAYSLVLRAFCLRGGPGLTWGQQQIISELRILLDISHETHIRELDALKTLSPAAAS